MTFKAHVNIKIANNNDNKNSVPTTVTCHNDVRQLLSFTLEVGGWGSTFVSVPAEMFR